MSIETIGMIAFIIAVVCGAVAMYQYDKYEKHMADYHKHMRAYEKLTGSKD